MIGKKIRRLRLEKEYSQEYMAIRLNLTQEAYSKIELQKTELTVTRLYQIAAILELSVQQLLI